MILNLPPSVRLYVATKPVDMRKSFDGLSALVEHHLEQDPLSGHLFCFFNRRREKVKLLWFDHGGYALFYKRLERGCFQIPEANENELLEYVPASFRVRKVRREKRACGKCRDTVVRAPAPSPVVERGRLGSGLVAQILVSKYLEHTPLYRQRQIYKRCRVSLPRSTLGDAVAAACQLLQPLARWIRERAFAQDILATDDTGLVVLDKSTAKGSRRGVLWPYVAGHRWAYFAYSPSREWRWPQEELKDYRVYVFKVIGTTGLVS